MNHGLFVCSSVEGQREYLHSSLTSWLKFVEDTSKESHDPKSFTINCFINFFTLKTLGSEEGKNKELHFQLRK